MNVLRKLARLFVNPVLCLCVLLLSSATVTQAADEIRIGAIFPLTGEGSFWGQNAQRGATMAVDEINNAGGIDGKKIKLIIEDDKCDPKSAVTAFQKLTKVDKVNLIVGSVCSSCSVAIAQLAQREKVLLLSPCSEAASLSEVGNYFFRTWAPADRQGARVAKYMKEKLGHERVAVLMVQNDFAESVAAGFKTEFEHLGGKIVRHEEYASSIKDLRPLLLRIVQAKPQAIYLASYYADGVLAVRQMKELKLELPVFGTSAINTADFFQPLGDLSNGIILADLVDSTTAEFKQEFEKRYAIDWPGITSCAGMAYDDVRILAEAIGKVGSKPSAVRDYLDSIENYAGSSGPITFDEKGDLTREHGLYKVQGGKVQLITQ